MKYSRMSILTIALLVEGGAVLLGLALAWYFNISLTPFSKNIAMDILLGTAGALPPFLFFMYLVSAKGERLPLAGQLRNKVITDIKDMFDGIGLADLALISLLAGFGEEILFRGVIQVRFGIVIASIVFGLMHSVSLAYVVVTIIMGLYIGSIFKSTGSLLIPIQLHFIYDFAALVYLKHFVKKPVQDVPDTGDIT